MKTLNETIKYANNLQDYRAKVEDLKKDIEYYFTTTTAFPSSNDDIYHHNNAFVGFLFLYRYLSKMIYGQPLYLQYYEHPIITLLANNQLTDSDKEAILKDIVELGVANIGIRDEHNIEKNILNYLISILKENKLYRHINSPYRQFLDIIISHSEEHNLTTLLQQRDSEGHTILAKAVIVNDSDIVTKLLNLGADHSVDIWDNKKRNYITLLSAAIEQQNHEMIKSLVEAKKYEITLGDATLLLNYMHDNVGISSKQTVEMLETLLLNSFETLFSKAGYRSNEVAIMKKFNKLKPLLLHKLLNDYVKPEIPGDLEKLCHRAFMYFTSNELDNFKITAATADAKNLIDQFIAERKKDSREFNLIFDTNPSYTKQQTRKQQIRSLAAWSLILSEPWVGYQNENDGETNLYKAAKNHVGMVSRLLSLGADPNSKNNNERGDTPLHFLVRDPKSSGRYWRIRKLIRAGADVNIQNNLGDTPLFAAVEAGNISVVKQLLKAGADIHLTNNLGETPLFEAVKNGRTDIVDLFLLLELDVNIQNNVGDTLLLAAAQKGHTEIVEKLLLSGATVNINNSADDTPLFEAVRNGHIQLVKALIKNGADVNFMNFHKNTALHLAVENNQLEVVVELLLHGAELQVPNAEGKTPLNIAEDKGYKNIANMLSNPSTKLNVTDNSSMQGKSVANCIIL